MVRTLVLNIDSKYRENYHTTESADFAMDLNYPLHHVLSMKLNNIQLPNSWYNITEAYNNNYIILDDFTYTIPDGSYTNITLPQTFNSITGIRLSDGVGRPFSTFYKITIDTNNARCTISKILASFPNGPDMTFRLTEDSSDPRDSLGWLFGFRPDPDTGSIPNTWSGYSGQTLYTGTSTFNMGAFSYMYLVVDDFNINGPELIVANLEDSYISGNILGIIRVNTANYQVVNADNYETQTRYYTKSVGINKLHVKLMDPDGDVINLNKMDFSLSLEFTIEE